MENTLRTEYLIIIPAALLTYAVIRVAISDWIIKETDKLQSEKARREINNRPPLNLN